MHACRWALGESKVLGKHVWFHLHILCQAAGFAVMTVGFGSAWKNFNNPPTGGSTGRAHQVLGTTVFALACLQLVGGLLRPGVDHPRRPIFNFMHPWLGRMAVAAAWANIYLGMVIWHRATQPLKLVTWVAPVASVMAAIVILDISLTIVAWSSNRLRPGQAPPIASPPSTVAVIRHTPIACWRQGRGSTPCCQMKHAVTRVTA
jgi:hypothetical protein